MSLSSEKTLFQVRNLSKHSLCNLELDVAAGERLVILGKSGSGKSVLLKCLLGFLRPDRGEIVVLDRKVEGRAATIPGLGVAFQEPGLFDAYDLAGNLRLSAPDGLDDEQLQGWLEALDLAKLSPHIRLKALSGGQRKRVSVARALLRGHRLVLLDEPTSGLDPVGAARITELVRHHMDHSSAGLVVITHDLDLAVSLGDRILVLQDGQLDNETPKPGTAPDDAKQELLRALEKEAEALPADTVRDRSLGWSLPATLGRLLAQGLPLSVVLMTLMAFILVPQIAGTGPMDLSRHVPGLLVEAVFRELAPLVVGLLLASRIGAGISAEVAGMSYTAQLATMKLLSLSPVRHLLVRYTLAAAVTFPLCFLAGAAASVLTAALSAGLGGGGLRIGMNRFLYLAGEALTPVLVLSVLVKGIVIGSVVAALAFRYGILEIDSAPRLGQAVTTASVASAVAVILVNLSLSWLFFTKV